MLDLFELEAAAAVAENSLIKQQIEEQEKYESSHCRQCGKAITDWEKVKQSNEEIILTYKCPCGYYADQHYKLVYDRTEEIV